jgi:hypothetical protein
MEKLMEKKNLSYFAAMLALLLLFPISKARAEDYIVVHAIFCPIEKDVIELADASRSGYVLRELIGQKISSGICTPPYPVNKKAGMVVKKLTPKKQVPYYCFREEIEKGKFSEIESCVLERFITTFRNVVAQRTGSYTVKRQSGNFYRVECSEGGIVTLEQRGEEIYRISDTFQLTMAMPSTQAVYAGKDINRAIQDGCKGVDYLLPPE